MHKVIRWLAGLDVQWKWWKDPEQVFTEVLQSCGLQRTPVAAEKSVGDVVPIT